MKSISVKYMALIMTGAILALASGCERGKPSSQPVDVHVNNDTESTADSQSVAKDSEGSAEGSQGSLPDNGISVVPVQKDNAIAVGQEINLLEKLKLLDKREDELGLSGKYGTVSDVNPPSIDARLIGEWYSADGSLYYVFSEEGVMKARYYLYDTKTETKYTTFYIEGTPVIAYDAIAISLLDQEEEDQTRTEIAYYAYDIVNGTLYMADIENVDEPYNSYVSTLQVLYKAESGGGLGTSVAKNPVAPESLYGVWDTEGLRLVIDEEGFKLDGSLYSYSFDDRGRLILEKDGTSTAYTFSLGQIRNYEEADRNRTAEQRYTLSLYYSGSSDEDIPNLAGYLTDWKDVYGWETWYYTMEFSRPGE